MLILSINQSRLLLPTAIQSVNPTLSFFAVCLTTFCVATCASAISANFDSMKTNSTMLGLVACLKMMMMVVSVLNFAVLQIVPPNGCSTIPSVLVLQDQVCRSGEF